MGKIKEKIKKLRNFKVYDYSIFEARDLNAAQSYISRASARGEIIKLGKGRFTKIGGKVFRDGFNLNNDGIDKASVSSRTIDTSKYSEFREFFWSNLSGRISLDNYIACVMQYDIVSKIAGLIALFGFLEVFKVYLNCFRSQGTVLKMFEGYIYER